MKDKSDTSSTSSPISDNEVDIDRFTRRKGCWAGEEMEMTHQSKQRNDSKDSREKTYAAVDLSQFRNTEVGVGYQAKGVIRQRSLISDKEKGDILKDMKRDEKEVKEEDCQEHREAKRSRILEKLEPESFSSVDQYLECDGLRKFRLELDSFFPCG